MIQIEAKNPSEAWLKATRYIVEHGNRVGELEREVLYLIVEIGNPLEINVNIDRVFRKIVGNRWVDEIADDFFPGNQYNLLGFPSVRKRWHYSYWERLTKYKGINQLEYVINRLRKRSRSKQVFCVTFDPEKDIKPMLDNPKRPFILMPCLTGLDFKCRKGKLNLLAIFRSHDFGRKAYGNYIGLGKLLKFVCQKTGHAIGKIVCISCSAHIRSREFRKIKDLVSGLNR